MIASTAPPVHRGGEIDHTHDIRNEMACHMELFSLPLLGEREREREKRLNKCARYKPLDNQGEGGYYGYVFQVGGHVTALRSEMDDDQSPDLWAE